MTEISPEPTIKIYGHRGARGLSPENSLASYRTALAIGVDKVDMDVGMTKDGIVVVTHDYCLNPDITRDAHGNWLSRDDIFIKDLTFAELQSYDISSTKPGSLYSTLFPHQYANERATIPSLMEVISFVKNASQGRVGFQIEIKTNPEHPKWTASPEKFAKAIADIITKEDVIENTEVQAFDYRCLLELQKINPHIATAYLTSEVARNRDPITNATWAAGHELHDFDNSAPKMIKSLGGKIWGPQDIELTHELVNEAHMLGLKVIPWSWPEQTKSEIDVATVKKLIAMNVDGIITDRPDILRGVLAAHGLKVPAAHI